jgi:Fe-S-cluster containining protein
MKKRRQLSKGQRRKRQGGHAHDGEDIVVDEKGRTVEEVYPTPSLIKKLAAEMAQATFVPPPFEEDREKADLVEKAQIIPLRKSVGPDVVPEHEKGNSLLCGGHCCRRFRFHKDESPESIWASYDQAMKQGRLTGHDIHLVAPMLIYLGRSHINGNGGYDEQASHWYSCKHLDTSTGLCTIYEHRPQVCRTHGASELGFAPCAYDRCEAKQQPSKPPPTVV